MTESIYLILWLAGLWVGAELIINAVLNISEHFKISHIFIGLTVLTLGTNLPELSIDITWAFYRLADTETSWLTLGNAIWSCFGQIGLTLWIIAFISTIYITKKEFYRDWLVMLGSVVLLFLFSIDSEITRTDGLILIMSYSIYLFYLFRDEKLHEKVARAPSVFVYWSTISLLWGFVVLIYCANLTIDNAIIISEKFKIDQSYIGLLTWLGTSLPELAVSIFAVRNKASSMAIGNLIGSNIFNTLFTLGVSSSIATLIINENFIKFDLPALFVLLIIVLVFFKKKMKLGKKEASILIGICIAYFILKTNAIW